MGELPSGTVTFLFTDVEGSTRLWDERPNEMKAALARHDAILHEAVRSHHGQVVKMTGDGAHAAFATARDAVGAALYAQRALSEEEWGPTPLRVRMGLHTGEAELREGDYFGGALNRAARLMGIAHGGQVLVSQVTADLMTESLPAGVEMRDLGEHRLRDLSRPERIFQLLGPGCAGEFPPLRSLDAFPGNLPVQLTAFVGRGEELSRVREELAQARLLTLTGVGGVGKTRLALEVAADAVPQYRDGAWLVELAGVRDSDAVPNAVVATFGLQPRAGVSTRDALVEFLRPRSLLLVVDNCEHLLRAVADVVGQVVRACAGVRVLATSREGLNVAGERILGVPSLDVPSEGAPREVIAACDAVMLFVERARAVKANFALDATNAGAVSQVCRRLDGIPLAIELAAARVAMLTPAELARRLDQRFRFLAAGQRSGGVERHQTLRAAIDWSYELLSEPERLLLARLSVFVGGFSFEAAEAVAVGDAVEADAVFELLAHLVGHHLVEADDTGVDTRYRLLETIRQYAQEHLDDSGDAAPLRLAHAGYYADFGEDAISKAMGADGVEWERRLVREFENIGAALTWTVDTRDTDTAVRLLAMWDAPLLTTFDFVPSSMVERAADAVLALPGASDHPRYPAALVIAAYSAYTQGDHELAQRRCNDALAAERRLGTDPSIGLALVQSFNALAQGHAGEAAEYASRAVEMARARGETSWLAQALAHSAIDHTMAGDAARARAYAEEMLVLRGRLANTRAGRSALAYAAWALRDSQPERALTVARELVAFAAPGETVAWTLAGDIAAYNGHRREALAYFDNAIRTTSGVRPVEGSTFGLIAALLADDDPEAAATLFGATDALAFAFAHSVHHGEVRRQAIAALQTSLGEARYAELYTQGRSMNDPAAAHYAHTAISHALDEHARNTSPSPSTKRHP